MTHPTPGRHPDVLTPAPRLAALLALLALLALASCQNNRELLVGFSGSLVGKTADLGVPGRDAVIMAVEEQNALGGVAGRPVRLLVRNDHRDPKVAWRVDEELIDAGAAAVIGHMTSDMTLAVLPLFNQRRVALISPTASASALAGLEDYLFRLRPGNEGEAAPLAQYLVEKARIHRVTVLQDIGNRQYTGDWADIFAASFQKLGGTVRRRLFFGGGDKVDYDGLAGELMTGEPQAVAVVADAVDSAMVCQQLRKRGFKGMIALSGWSLTAMLTQHGGAAVEGVIASHPYRAAAANQKWLDFAAKFKKRFGYEPNFAAMHAYDAAQLLFMAQAKAWRDGLSLKDALGAITEMDGLQGRVEFDRFGDAHGRYWVETICDGQMCIID